MLFESSRYKYYLQLLEKLNMTDTTEPAGAARFTAASYPNAPTSITKAVAGSVSTPPRDQAAVPAIASLEQRIAELEAVVHSIAHVADPSTHGVVLPWLEKVGARIKAAVEKL